MKTDRATKVLIVDDDLDTRRLLMAILRRDYLLDQAASGEEAPGNPPGKSSEATRHRSEFPVTKRRGYRRLRGRRCRQFPGWPIPGNGRFWTSLLATIPRNSYVL